MTDFICRTFLALVLAVSAALVSAQPKAPAPQPPSPAAKDGAPAAEAAPAQIPLTEVPDRSEAVTAEIRTTEAELAKNSATPRVANALAVTVRDIDILQDQTKRAAAGDLSLAAVQELTERWQKIRDALGEARRDLLTHTASAEKHAARLTELEKQWTATLSLAQAPDAPQAVRNRVQTTIDAIKKGRAAVDRHLADAIALLDRIARQDSRVSSALATVEAAREKALTRLFVTQTTPIWQLDLSERARADPVQATQDTLSNQWAQFVEYARRDSKVLLLHLFVTVALVGLLIALRRRVHERTQVVPALAHTAQVFDMPLAAALVLSVLGSRWLYVDAPRIFWATLGAAALIATVTILRRIGDRRLAPILYAVIGFYVIDQIRLVMSALPTMSRLLFIVEMLAGAVFALQLSRWVAQGEQRETRLSRWTRRGAWLVLVLFFGAAAANALGFTNLADLLARSVLGSAYTGVILYAAVLVIDALVLLALHGRPLALSRLVRRHTDRMWQWMRRLVRSLATLFWVWLALDRLTLLDPVVAATLALLATRINIGIVDITFGHLLAFAITLWIAFIASRLARFILEEDIFTRVYLPSGVPYTIARTTHYLIVVVGFLVALAMLGVDMTKFTILIGALTVGIGFGLQNIINNFVSGLILLFERPVKVGDVIQMEDQVGVVKRIGIRASVIRTAAGADLILPNGKFISDRVTNWTRASHYRPIEIPIAVVLSSNAREVMALLARAAAGQPGVVETPPPEVVLTKFGADALNFELRVWTDRAEDWTRVRSDVALAINEALNEAKIGIK